MEHRAEIECACCGKLVTAPALKSDHCLPHVLFDDPDPLVTTVRVDRTAKMYCESCVESTKISRKKAMDFKTGNREVVILTKDSFNLYADSLILSTKSEVFEKMFKVEMLEKQTRKVNMAYVKTETVLDFLFFLYQHQLREVPSGEGLKELLQLAHLFDVKELVHILDTYTVPELAKTPLDLELMKLGFIYDLPKTKHFLRQNATKEIMDQVCDSLGENCPWYVEYFKTVLASPNITWKGN